MKQWINEDIFKSWTQAQKRLWDSLCSAVPFQPLSGTEAWRDTYLKNLNTWEVAVKKTLSQEASWVRRWVEQVAHEKGSSELMTVWVRQMEDVLQRWVETQNQWWDEYFAVLRRGGGFMQAGAGMQEFSSTKPVTQAQADLTIASTVDDSASATAKPVAQAEADLTIAPTIEDSAPVMEATTAPAPVVTDVQEQSGEVTHIDSQTPSLVASAPIQFDPTQPDDLKLIVGIGPALEKKLHGQGITSFRQLAAIQNDQINQLESAIKATGRIVRDDWIAQAKALHLQKYQEQL